MLIVYELLITHEYLYFINYSSNKDFINNKYLSLIKLKSPSSTHTTILS